MMLLGRWGGDAVHHPGQVSFEGQLVVFHSGPQQGVKVAHEIGTQKAISPGDQGCFAPGRLLAFLEGFLSSETSCYTSLPL